jgi:hypothetical protein
VFARDVVDLLAWVLGGPVRLVWRPLAAWRWKRQLATEMNRRPSDVVNVFDHGGRRLGNGVRYHLDASHSVFAIPCAWKKQAATVKEITGHEIHGAEFYCGKSEWLVR